MTFFKKKAQAKKLMSLGFESPGRGILIQAIKMTATAYRAWRGALYLTGAYPYTIQDDEALQSFVGASSYNLGIDEFAGEQSDLEVKLV